MPQVDLVRNKSRRLPLMVAGGAVLVVVLIVIGVLVARQMQTPKVDAVAIDNEVRELAFAGKDNEALAVLREAIAKTKNSEDKLSFYLKVGGIMEGKEDYKAAVEAYKSADDIRSTFGTNYALGRAAEAAGDKAQALEGYKKAQSILKDGQSKQNNDYLPLVEAAIARLEAK